MGQRSDGGWVARSAQPVDWIDLACAVFVGVISALVKIVKLTKPDWHLGITDSVMPFLLTTGYIIARARHQPEKLDEWGITTPVSWSAIVAGLILLGTGIGCLAAAGLALAGRPAFEPFLVPQMINYILGAFPQQFFMCSVGLATLAKLRPFRGRWRLPLAVGLVFSLAHFWTPAHFPGTIVPIQMAITFPAGFAVTLYFLKFRNILPLTAIHAILYVLLHNWVELSV